MTSEFTEAKDVKIKWVVGSINSGFVLYYRHPMEEECFYITLSLYHDTTDDQLLLMAYDVMIENLGLHLPENVKIER
jgi:hypothetical protein